MRIYDHNNYLFVIYICIYIYTWREATSTRYKIISTIDIHVSSHTYIHTYIHMYMYVYACIVDLASFESLNKTYTDILQ